MKKISLLLLISILLPFTGFAEKVLVGISDGEDVASTIEYNQQGKVVKISGGAVNDYINVEVDWTKFNDGFVSLAMNIEGISFNLDVLLDNKGRAIKVADPSINAYLYEFSYDENNNLITANTNLDDYIAKKTLVWENGNLVKITGNEIYEDGSTPVSVNIQYTDVSHPQAIDNKGEIIGGLLSFGVDTDDFGILSFMQMMGLIGNRSKNLPVSAVARWEGYPSFQSNFSYVLDSEGYPIEATTEEDGEVMHNYFTWGDIQLGIEDALNPDKTVVGIYDLNGIKLTEPKKGINIIRYSDGTTQKLVVE